MPTWRATSGCTLAILAVGAIAAAGEQPLTTRWAANVDATNVLPDYPRPRLRRPSWSNLNGVWGYAITPREADRPQTWDGDILVPFCVESSLSGVARPVGPDETLWYRRSFERPSLLDDQLLLLHFGAVDWDATVFVNGLEIGRHQGGYDAFTLDITDAVHEGLNDLIVRVWDPTDAGFQPRGKQVRGPKGIWYTAVTGIWQTVWLEPVPRPHITGVRLTPLFDDNAVHVEVTTSPAATGARVVVASQIGRRTVRGAGPVAEPIMLHPRRPIPPWSPDDPVLHDVTVTLENANGRVLDRVETYFGFRSIEVGPDANGVNRLLLNGEPLFQYGTLDQGWWPDGLYTAPTDEALRFDLEITKQLGFNMVRKHVKIEPARWYTWCDILGLLVWQDMPSGDAFIGGDMPDIKRSAESAANFKRELAAMIDGMYSHPSVVMWVPYNEGWGQWDTAGITDLVRTLDPTRLVNPASGWTDRGTGDVIDIHRYPGPAMAPVESGRASVLGEFGGLGLALPGHLWQEDKNWGYRTLESRDALTSAYERLLRTLRPLIGDGLAAAVYTQTTDVEIEVNGLMTYDRAVVKMDEAAAARAAERLFLPPPEITTIVPASRDDRAPWRYTFATPPADWVSAAFDDSGWAFGPGGFGTKGTPGASIGTRWQTDDIWIRRSFDLARIPPHAELLIHHDEDAEVYINGVLAARPRGYVTAYGPIAMDVPPRDCLRRGRNTIAIHCRNTSGGQFIDAGFVSVKWPDE